MPHQLRKLNLGVLRLKKKAIQRIGPYKFNLLDYFIESLNKDYFLYSILFILVSIDVVFFIFYLIMSILGILDSKITFRSLDLNNFFSLASIWNYGKLMLLCSTLVFLSVRLRRVSFSVMAFLFLLLFFDDYFEIHDRIGRAIGQKYWLGPLEILGPQNQGETFVYLIIFLIALVLIWIVFATAQRQDRAFFESITVGIFVLGFFGVVVDVLHGFGNAFVNSASGSLRYIINNAFVLVEDGGELLAISICLWLGLARLKQLSDSTGIPSRSDC